MQVITSPDNPRIRLCHRLQMKKYRDRTGLYLAEGPNLLREALEAGAPIREVLLAEGKEEAYRELLEEIQSRRPALCPVVLSQKLYASLADTEAGQGVISLLEKPDVRGPEQERSILRPGANVLILDRLQDPGNIGTLIRTAEGAGYGGVLILRGTADVFAPKVVRAAAGSLLRMPLLFRDTPEEAAALLRAHGKRMVAAQMGAAARYWEAALATDIGLIIGNEGGGICRALLEGADLLVSLPMAGHLESLNAAVAGGILMYEAVRRIK